ncbi:MAG: alpha-mannosidase [Micromonosporaceae bacterium]|nr:alpha-mannosidase [Micromonosporaceae bacterium]
MHDDRRLVEQRLDRILTERVLPAQYAAWVPLKLEAWPVPGEPVPVAEALAAAYQPFAVGQLWGAPWSTMWLRASATVPQGWAGKRVEAVFDLGLVPGGPGNQAEALVYTAAGVPLKGIAPRNQYVPVARPARGGEPVELLLEVAANPDVLGAGFKPSSLGDTATAGTAPLYRMTRADLAVLDEEVFGLTLDMQVLAGLMTELDVGDPRRHEILRALQRATEALDLDDIGGTAAAGRAQLAQVLSRPANASAHRVSAVGHAHIDTAWLWPLRETVRKASRTFASATALAADYPELVFAAPQAQQYDWVKQHHPEIYRRIAAGVKTGQWVPVGGMWVEADGNLPGGEALVRQLVLGKRFFLDEFGVECNGVWLPDSFGYTAAYPQLALLAGMRWFLTQKLSWNDTDKMPHHTFWWEGIDGSRVFTHFPPVDTYNGVFSGHEMARSVRNFAEKGRATRSLIPFGYGDGGGGPTREMLERARRMVDLEGAPRLSIEDPDAFFDAALAEYPDAPVWSGEMYLELHRATFTSQARGKAGNRRSEHLLREAELWAATAAVHAGVEYPYETLDRLWKTVLLLQFHDILPGSSIRWVHREAEATYARVRDELSTVVGSALAALSGTGDGLLVANAGPFARTEVAVVPAQSAPARAQPLADGSAAVLVDAPAGGLGTVAATLFEPVRVTDRVLENGLVRVELDQTGAFGSVRDLRCGATGGAGAAGREVLAPGHPGNLLRLHPDLPGQWDAWDVDRGYGRVWTDLTTVDAIEVAETGPLLGALRVERSFGGSRISQTIRLRAGSPMIEVDCEVDWHEREKFLKALFPLDVHADRSAAEIQFGHVFRPTHTNTSWDAARFEVYAHRWIHVGEAGYGVALVTDSTYGYHAVRDSRPDGGTTTTVGLSLLRAPRSPDPEADQGAHRFRYALLPGVDIAGAVAGGYRLNLPLRPVPGTGAAALPPLVTVEGDGVTVEAVKLADDRSGDVVVRLYEAYGGRAAGRLRTGFGLARAYHTDLLERRLSEAGLAPDGTVPVALRPFQVLTLRLVRS